VEAPRIWSQGQELEMEQDIPAAVRDAVAARGHRVVPVGGVAGGMNAVAFAADGTLEGAACWRADGTPIGLAGGWRVRGPIWAGVIGCVIPDERPLNPQDSGRLPVGTPVVLPVDYCTNLHG
jgi:dienelactone hydrolase